MLGPSSAAVAGGLEENGVVKRCRMRISIVRKAEMSRRALGGSGDPREVYGSFKS